MHRRFQEELQNAVQLWPQMLRATVRAGAAANWLAQTRMPAIVGSGCSKLSARTLEMLLRRQQKNAFFLGPFQFLSTTLPWDVVVLCSAYCGHHHAIRVARRALQMGAKLIVISVVPSEEMREIAVRHPERVELLHPGLVPPVGGFVPIGTSLAQLAVVTNLLLGKTTREFEEVPADAYRRWSENFRQPGLNFAHVRYVHSLLTDLSLPAATDLETRLLESGTCAHIAHDLFDFCHGRFVSAHAERDYSLIVAYCDREYGEDVKLLLRHFSDDLQIVVLESDLAGPAAAIHHVIGAFALVDALSEARQIDPSQPGLPDWAEAVYIEPGRREEFAV